MKTLKLLADQTFVCRGNGLLGDQTRRHPECYGIAKGDTFVERDPRHDGYGPRHCVKCFEMYFAGR